ncbi:probable serine/threonine-protein kinase At1g54610 [Vicia villosa]|uniref:probable serine/threonine-protein kinase At1g54610 n=1 Tax=Vicia villosa TaxID=3911 RepID=UPI00273B088F|nr:probable serine/threonine-protein kinase At1g54610 [Vicia villosa]
MGCVYSKKSAVVGSKEGLTASSKRNVGRNVGMNVSRLDIKKRTDEVLKKDELLDGVCAGVSLNDDKEADGSARLYDDKNEKKKMMEKTELDLAVVVDYPSFGGRVPKALEGEQVAAGWPTWLSSVAGEAIHGWTPRSASTFEKYDKIGQGTYSTVFKARDLISQKTVALKRVRFDNLDHESVKFMAREIVFLRRLDHPNIIKLEGLITSQTSRSMYLVFEYMEHDLTGLATAPGIKFSEPQVKCYMKQLLRGLDHCHSRGVLHRDIKGSNLLIDNKGILKIADFGLANFFDPDHSAPLTSRVVTLWYRPPELLLGSSNYGVEVDMWSTGCILGELYNGRPILPGKTEVEQLHRIFKLCGSPSVDYWHKLRLPHSTVFRPPHHYRNCVADTFKEFPSAATRLIETLLSLDPLLRGTAATALSNEFFSLEPVACDPSELPKYPPSKEIHTKMREESTRRHKALGEKEQKVGPRVKQEKETQSFVLSKANADARISTKHEQRFPNMAGQDGLFSRHRESVSGLLVSPQKQSEDINETVNYFSGPLYQKPSDSGLLVPGLGRHNIGKEAGEQPLPLSNKVNLSKYSKPSPTLFSGNRKGIPAPLRPRDTIQAPKSLGLSNGSPESKRLNDKKCHSQKTNLSKTENRKDWQASSKNNLYMIGSLKFPSNNMRQVIKERDRKTQEYSR